MVYAVPQYKIVYPYDLWDTCAKPSNIYKGEVETDIPSYRDSCMHLIIGNSSNLNQIMVVEKFQVPLHLNEQWIWKEETNSLELIRYLHLNEMQVDSSLNSSLPLSLFTFC